MTNSLVVLTTCGSSEEAERIAHLLVERRLAACVNIAPPVRSVYRWNGRIENAAEWLLLIKTTAARFDALSQTLRETHSYEVPEILALPVALGSAPYLSWLESETNE